MQCLSSSGWHDAQHKPLRRVVCVCYQQFSIGATAQTHHLSGPRATDCATTVRRTCCGKGDRPCHTHHCRWYWSLRYRRDQIPLGTDIGIAKSLRSIAHRDGAPLAVSRCGHRVLSDCRSPFHSPRLSRVERPPVLLGPEEGERDLTGPPRRRSARPYGLGRGRKHHAVGALPTWR